MFCVVVCHVTSHGECGLRSPTAPQQLSTIDHTQANAPRHLISYLSSNQQGHNAAFPYLLAITDIVPTNPFPPSNNHRNYNPQAQNQNQFPTLSPRRPEKTPDHVLRQDPRPLQVHLLHPAFPSRTVQGSRLRGRRWRLLRWEILQVLLSDARSRTVPAG